QSGCPLCRAIWRMDTTRFAWYVNDGVLDEETQGQVARALGFCAPHALSLSLLEGDDTLWSHLGSCMVYIHVIQYALLPQLQRFLASSGHRFLPPLMSKVFSRLRHFFHPDLCPLCFDHRQHETIYTQRFVEAFCSNVGFREMYLH